MKINLKLRLFEFLVGYQIRHFCIGAVERGKCSGATMAINTQIVSKYGAHTTPSHVPRNSNDERLTNESIKSTQIKTIVQTYMPKLKEP